ncbi:alkyl hydroperoxide reductase subunit F [Propionibacterium australiense]|uniref:Alkyl hydroperoxide reductase subunit F n=1 Tax=Propionibacterium australiense TaxID=119981 RepID=A0A383S5E8_9ACTN|nr:alkyl hydroperoxide reductase subunit F [Propionibacterium australiense]RLP11948.1 alkyl hydroperoxide reductase subunit F [Propionibacterium australiense]RLP12586.1 alkyl hydroperoxide reductase subunit F [Propionibacterium australiense]SYZ32589.1 Alkyl hydroperoxide reductase subunit F [Propionibacterium australiense]VEH91660.1 Alkyl hydroperoxide reductase subunit F [Propionibacterium australiense]
MAVLDEKLIAQLSALMDRITRPVEFVVSLDDREQSNRIDGMLRQVAALSERISVRRDDTAHERRPSFSLTSPGTGISITFSALPLGHEFTSFALALLQVGGNPVKLDEATIEAVRAVQTDQEFTTYISLTCQNCPTVVQAINAMAVLNPRIRHTVVDGSLFRDEVEARNILATPTIYLNGELFGQGRMEAAQIIAALDPEAGAAAAAGLNDREPYQVLVVGQGPAGVSAAIYLARKGIRTGLVGDRFGGQVNDTMAIENLVSVPHTEGPRLARDLRAHAGEYGDIDIIDGVTVTGLTRAGDGTIEIQAGPGATLRARAVILATGASWRHMGVPGEQEYRNKGVTYCPHCDGPLFKDKDVAVIGGGNSGVEAALDLAGVARSVTVIEFMPECKADEVLLQRMGEAPNIDVVTNAAVQEVLGDGTRVQAIRYRDRAGGEETTVRLDGVFVQIGLAPNTGWLPDEVDRDARGQIVIDTRGATSMPGVFAAGDCTDTPYKQIVIASGAGATAGLSAWDWLVRTQP